MLAVCIIQVREWSIDRGPMPTVYYPYSHLSFTSMIFMVRAQRNPLSLSEPARRIIRGLDPAQPIAEIRTMEDLLGENFARQRFSAWLLSGFSMVALVLAGGRNLRRPGLLSYGTDSQTRRACGAGGRFRPDYRPGAKNRCAPGGRWAGHRSRGRTCVDGTAEEPFVRHRSSRPTDLHRRAVLACSRCLDRGLFAGATSRPPRSHGRLACGVRFDCLTAIARRAPGEPDEC